MKSTKRTSFLSLLLFTFLLLPLISRGVDEKAAKNNWQWQAAPELDIRGKGWDETSSPFARFPARAEDVVRTAVWNLSQDTSGLYIEFSTDAPSLRARWSPLKENLAMNHMAATGVSGLDLYVRHEGEWRFLAVGRPKSFPDNETSFFKNIPAETREFRLYFPLYNGLKSLELGVPAGHELTVLPASDLKPIVFYGTSILQGGCASRPGMSYTSILGRRFDWPVLNLGFSGNGKGEPEVAELIADIDPALFVLDPLPNISSDVVAERLETFVQILRKKHPETPILLVESVTYPSAFLIQSRGDRVRESNAHLKEAFDRLVQAGDKNLYYHTTENLLGDDGEDTVDGVHPTDLGFLRMANGLEPNLLQILSGKQSQKNKILRPSHPRSQRAYR